MPPNHSLQPTPAGVGSSAFAGYVTGPAWLSLGRSPLHTLAHAQALQVCGWFKVLLGDLGTRWRAYRSLGRSRHAGKLKGVAVVLFQESDRRDSEGDRSESG